MNDIEGKIETLKTYLKGGVKKIAIVAHANPDGDAIGSSLGWAHVLKSMGHEVNCLVPNKYPYFLEWMPGIKSVIIYKDQKDEAQKAIADSEFIFCLDFNRIDRLEGLSELISENKTAKRILIDHHLNPPDEYDLAFSDPQTCSTSYLVYKITEKLVGTDVIDKSMGESLYAGIMTDTGNFSFSYLTPDLFRAVAVLVEKGVDIPKINAAVYNSYVEGRVRLLGFVLADKMKLIEDGSVAYIALKERELRRFDFQQGDSEGFVNYPLSISGVKMSAMFLETRKYIRISLRSRGDVDVNVFANKYFGGGGHKNAAGGKSFESMDKTIEKYKQAVAEFFGEDR